MDDLTREFLIESGEGLDRMERCLTDLEKSPGDAALIAEIFRSVHTIKGTTGFLGYKRLEKLAHAGENLLGLLREGKIRANAAVVTALLLLLDALRSILRSIEADQTEGTGDDTALILQLEQLQHIPQEAVVSAPANPAILPPRKARTRVPRSAQKPGTSTSAPSPLPSQTEPSTAPPLMPPPASLPKTSAPAEVPEEPKSNATALAAAESTLRVDITLLNRMMNLVGELVLTRNQVLQATAAVPGLTLLTRRLDMITADLRESVMKARMQPVSNVFSKVPRLVRDLCQSLGRRVRLEVEGQETELDKSLLEAIKDPLIHAVRNALDHGIESPDARIAAGKDPEGTLKLRAVPEGSHVIIEVSDDGSGIPVDRVREKAVERGLISAERASQQSERELLQLVFVPGFSTASTITKVSGRGVGMDVVRTNVEKIGGKVELDSRPGQGTTLRLRIPLTLAIIPALIVRSVGQSFALPQVALSELVHVPAQKFASAIEWIEDAPLYRLRGNLLPLVFLDRMLSPSAPQNHHAPRESYIAVLDADGRRYGLVVEGLADPEEIVVKPLNTALKGIALYSGATVLGSGNLALILDPGAIALRAGIAISADEKNLPAPAPVSSLADRGNEYLLVDIAGRRAAVLLDNVLRIEQIAASRIEYIGDRPVLNFEGQVLSVADTAGLIAASEPGSQIVIVVCRDGSGQVGVVVSHVLDVAAGSDLVEAGTSRCTRGAKLLKDNVTGIVDLAQFTASAMIAADATPLEVFS